MTHLERLKELREKEAKVYKGYAGRIIERQEKFKIKQDIKKIKAAGLRARFGITKERVEKTGKFVSGFGKGLGYGIKKMGKVALALGESSKDYYEQREKELKRRK